MAHLHGERAYGTGGGSSNQNLITGLDRDSADSTGSGEGVAVPPQRLSSTGSELEAFEENPDLEAKLRESTRGQLEAPVPELPETENAAPVAVGPISAPLQFDGFVSFRIAALVPGPGLLVCEAWCSGQTRRVGRAREGKSTSMPVGPRLPPPLPPG